MPHHARTAFAIGAHSKRGTEATRNLRRNLSPECVAGGPEGPPPMRFLFLGNENRDATVFRATLSRVVVRDRMLIAIPFRFNPAGIDSEPAQCIANSLGSCL